MKKLILLVFAGSVFISCDKKDPVIPNEEELITTLIYTLTSGTGEEVKLSFKDIDGEGGQPPVITTGALKANTTYTGKLTLLNEMESPADNITEEILEEADEHQFFFTISGLDASVSYDDTDSAGFPVGLKTKLVTGGPSSGKLTITLRHEPNKSASGVSSGQLTNAGGETDIEVTFDLNIE
jgi:hypothetical protein